MTTYKGEKLDPILPDAESVEVLEEILEIQESLKSDSARLQELYEILPYQTPMVVEVGGEYRTFIIDTPAGHFVTYRQFDMAMNAKTTKADMKELDL